MAKMMNETESNLGNIPYYLKENGAASKAKGTPVYTAVVPAKETYAIADVAERMAAEGCAVRPATITLVLSEFAELVAKLMAEGRAVNIGGVVRFAPAIRGTFASEKEAFDPARHHVVVNATVGNRLRAAAAESEVRRIHQVILPTVDELYNMVDATPGTVCSRGQFMVKGTRMTWDDSKADEGFILNLFGVETKCRVVMPDATGKRLVLQTSQAMEVGDTPELWFYTRIDGGLFQVKYKGPLTCVAPNPPSAA